jgi:hypothetical protein
MKDASPVIRAWAQQLLGAEAANRSATDANVHAAVRVCEKLRSSLAPFVGLDGFTALLRRALVLARADVPSLQTTKVAADGRLERTEESPAKERKDNEEAIAITAHLLGLLVTFIGESLTSRLTRNAFPDATKVIVVPEEDE